MTHRPSPYLQGLFDGPIDVVGDVHGELDALHALMRGLGYDPVGGHPEGRRLVFLGDLCDRGPDSPGVLALALAPVLRPGMPVLAGAGLAVAGALWLTRGRP